LEHRIVDLEAAREKTCLPIERKMAYETMTGGDTGGPARCPQTAKYRAALVAKRSSPPPREFRKQAVQQLPVKEFCTEGLFAELTRRASTRR
jgi:hypothetical protein